MTRLAVGALVVESTPIGILTRTDVVRVVGEGRDPGSTTVATAMTADVEVVARDCSLSDAAALMTDLRVHHLPVSDDGEVVGMLSAADVAAHLPRFRPPDPV
jgi:CBS domain-containing protein